MGIMYAAFLPYSGSSVQRHSHIRPIPVGSDAVIGNMFWQV